MWHLKLYVEINKSRILCIYQCAKQAPDKLVCPFTCTTDNSSISLRIHAFCLWILYQISAKTSDHARWPRPFCCHCKPTTRGIEVIDQYHYLPARRNCSDVCNPHYQLIITLWIYILWSLFQWKIYYEYKAFCAHTTSCWWNEQLK